MYILIMASLLKKIIKGRPYYYAVVSKRINGKPKIVQQTYLGTAEAIIKRLTAIPDPLEVEHTAFGEVAALWAQAEELDLINLIDGVIAQHGNREISIGTFLTVGAINRAVDPRSKDGVGRWIKKTVLGDLLGQPAEAFDSQSFWDAMDLVEDHHLEEIEETLWKKILTLYGLLTDVLLWDTTNFATHMDGLTSSELAQRGKPKQGSSDQRLIGLGMAATPVIGLPFLHKVYAGNQHDAKLFPEALRLLVNRYQRLAKTSDGLTLIIDKGNNSKENIEFGNGQGVSFIGSLKPSHFPQFLRIPLNDYTESVGSYRVHRRRAKVFEKKRTVIITFHPKLYERQRKTLQARLEKASLALERRFKEEQSKEEYRHKPEVLLKQYEAYLKKKGLHGLLRVKIRGHRLIICKALRPLRKREKSFGKTILFSDRDELSSQQIIDAYHGKNVLEENFKFLKERHYLHFEPVYHWTDQKIKVHALMCVLGLILVKLLLYRISQANLSMSLPVLMEELKDMKKIILVYPQGQVKQKLSKLSSIQQQLFRLFNLSKYIDSC
jgi:transposase